MHDLFVERLGNIAISDGVARLDFLRLEATPEGKPSLHPGIRLVIPLGALAQIHAMLGNLRDEMAKQNAAAPAPAAEPAVEDSGKKKK